MFQWHLPCPLPVADTQTDPYGRLGWCRPWERHYGTEVRQGQAKANPRTCTCGQTPGVHKTTTWTRQTLFGPLVVHDPYVYCKKCHEAARPLHAVLGTDRET